MPFISPRVVRSLSALALVAAPSLARADVEPDPQHDVSLTFSPVHLLLPMFEAQAEFKLDRKIGLAAILGAGGASVETSDGDSASAFVFDVGAKFAWYAVGDFEEGMQLGLEVLYLGVSGEGDGGDLEGVEFAGTGLSVSPFIGYKIVADVGFTFEIEAGPAFVFVTASDDEGDSDSAVTILPMVNLNVGWSL